MTEWLAAASKGCTHPPTCRPIPLFTVRSGGEARPAQLERIKTHPFRPGICEPRIPTAYTDLHSSAKIAFSWQGRTETTAACKRPPSLGPGSSDPTCEQGVLCSRAPSPSRAPVPTFDRRQTCTLRVAPICEGRAPVCHILTLFHSRSFEPFFPNGSTRRELPPEPRQRAPGRAAPRTASGSTEPLQGT